MPSGAKKKSIGGCVQISTRLDVTEKPIAVMLALAAGRGRNELDPPNEPIAVSINTARDRSVACLVKFVNGCERVATDLDTIPRDQEQLPHESLESRSPGYMRKKEKEREGGKEKKRSLTG